MQLKFCGVSCRYFTQLSVFPYFSCNTIIHPVELFISTFSSYFDKKANTLTGSKSFAEHSQNVFITVISGFYLVTAVVQNN